MNYRESIVKNHQIMSFSGAFAYMENGENIFWPGCAMLSFGKELNNSTYNLLKSSIPDLSISTFCCGNPSMHIYEGKDFAKRMKFIGNALKKNGVKNIYTLCPNCYVTLSENTDLNVKSAWYLIDECFPEESRGILNGASFLIHDPCPIVKDIDASYYVRNILRKMGAEVLEFKNNRKNTICCGKKNMIMALDPKKGKAIFKRRIAQCESRKVVTYCASCVDTYRDNSFTAHHVLELMFQIDAKTSWINRYKAVKDFKKG